MNETLARETLEMMIISFERQNILLKMGKGSSIECVARKETSFVTDYKRDNIFVATGRKAIFAGMETCDAPHSYC